MSMMEADEARAISALADRLADRFPDVAPDQVSVVVEAAHRRYDGSRIRTFVPVLVEHDAVERLKPLAESRSSDPDRQVSA